MTKLKLLTLPIGNLQDLTVRVKEALSSPGLFLCEDTRSFKEFLQLNGLPQEGKRIISFHDQSSDSSLNEVLNLISEAGEAFFCSEAGSPVISDPAYPLLKGILEKGGEIDSFPGVSSVVVALELSGLPAVPFHFHGFLPRNTNDKKSYCKQNFYSGQTHIFFESPHRIMESLETLCELAPLDTNIVVAREMTKKFQSVLRFKSQDFQNKKSEITVKGEFVVLVNSGSEAKAENSLPIEEVRLAAKKLLESGGHPKDCSKLLALILDQSSKEIYQQLISRNK